MLPDIALLLVRLVVGALFVGHGTQKLFGWFGGYGLMGTGSYMESLGLRPGRFWAAVAGTGETLGGLLFLVGFFNPVGPILITAVMIFAISRVHLPKGLWVDQGGYEYPLTHVAVVVALSLMGPGAYSLDAAFATGLPPVVTLAAGAIGIALVFFIAGLPTVVGREASER